MVAAEFEGLMECSELAWALFLVSVWHQEVVMTKVVEVDMVLF
jgi:hypothetical protein